MANVHSFKQTWTVICYYLSRKNVLNVKAHLIDRKIFSMYSIVKHLMMTLWVFEILSNSFISETAIPRSRFMKTKAMLMRNMKKNILAKNPASGFLANELVKSSSLINIARILMKASSNLVKEGVFGKRRWKTRQNEKSTMKKERKNFVADMRTRLIIIRWIPIDGISERTMRLKKLAKKIKHDVIIRFSSGSISMKIRTPNKSGWTMFQIKSFTKFIISMVQSRCTFFLQRKSLKTLK